MFVKDQFSESEDEGIDCSRARDDGNPSESMAKQSFAEEADINTIVRRFGLTGQLPEGVRMPEYGDFTNVGTFHEALSAVEAARDAFAMMPAHVRERFLNDAGKFVDFCLDDKNYEEASKLGLVKAEVLEARRAAAEAAAKVEAERFNRAVEAAVAARAKP